jgi:hypothetical protein
MKYSIGDSLADYGFGFYEKLHEPILLINKIGEVKKINEAGRKLLKIAKLTTSEIEALLINHLYSISELAASKTTLIRSRNRKLHLKTSKLWNSDYFLIEIQR